MDNIKKIIKFYIFSLIFVFILGTLLHFTYDWFNQNPIIAIFSSINESVWEHQKLIFFPMVITSIIGYFYIGKNLPNYICSRALGIISSILFIIIFYYTYTGIIGKNFAILDIGSFFVGAIIGEYVSFKRLFSFKKCNKYLAIIIITILFALFVIFTFYQPKLNVFENPKSQTHLLLKLI